jgi:hypothetical protein
MPVNRNSLLHSISVYCHALYTTTNCGEQTALNLGLILHRTAILSVVLYGCKIWSVILSAEPRLRVFKDRVHRKTFCLKRERVRGGWKKLHSEELHDLYLHQILLEQ